MDKDEVIKRLIHKLDGMIKDANEQKQTFEKHHLVASELTSGAMEQAYKNVKEWVLTEF